MKLRTFAMAGVAAVVLAGPASAQTTGWYLGLGFGWTQLDSQFNWQSGPPTPTVSMPREETMQVNAAIGYKLPIGIRVELEPTYSKYRLASRPAFGVGDVQIRGDFINVAYDYPIFAGFNLTVG